MVRQLFELRGEIARRFRRAGIDEQRRFEEGELVDREPPHGGLDREKGARRHAVDAGSSPRFAEERGEILHLAFDGVRWRVPAVATTTAIVAMDRELRREKGCQRRPGRAGGSIVERTADENERRPVSHDFESDAGAVGGSQFLHRRSFHQKRYPCARKGTSSSPQISARTSGA
jgi:hypothetical protein